MSCHRPAVDGMGPAALQALPALRTVLEAAIGAREQVDRIEDAVRAHIEERIRSQATPGAPAPPQPIEIACSCTALSRDPENELRELSGIAPIAATWNWDGATRAITVAAQPGWVVTFCVTPGPWSDESWDATGTLDINFEQPGPALKGLIEWAIEVHHFGLDHGLADVPQALAAMRSCFGAASWIDAIEADRDGASGAHDPALEGTRPSRSDIP